MPSHIAPSASALTTRRAGHFCRIAVSECPARNRPCHSRPCNIRSRHWTGSSRPLRPRIRLCGPLAVVETTNLGSGEHSIIHLDRSRSLPPRRQMTPLDDCLLHGGTVGRLATIEQRRRQTCIDPNDLVFVAHEPRDRPIAYPQNVGELPRPPHQPYLSEDDET